MRKSLSLLGLATSLALSGLPSAEAARGGTSIMHFMVRAPLQGTEGGPAVSGEIDVKQNRQGNANVQRVKIDVAGLTPNTTYNLLVDDGATTNDVTPAFTTDDQGKAHVEYMSNGNGRGGGKGKGNGNGNGVGKGKKQALPPSMNPLSEIKAIAIEDPTVVNEDLLTGASVAWFDLTDPSKLQYLVKRPMTNTGVLLDASGDLDIKVNNNSVKFNLHAEGLTPGATYNLSINDGTAVPVVADENGELDIDSLPEGSPDVLDIVRIELQDEFEADVLTTSFID